MNQTQLDAARAAICKSFGVLPEAVEIDAQGQVFMMGRSMGTLILASDQPLPGQVIIPLTGDPAVTKRVLIDEMARGALDQAGVPTPPEFNDQALDEEEDDDEDDYEPDDEFGDGEDEYERPANHGTFWTTCDTERAIEAFGSGRSVETIAKELGRSPFAVVCKLTQRGVLSEAQREVFRATDELPTVGLTGLVYTLNGQGNVSSPEFGTKENLYNWFRARREELTSRGVTTAQFITVERVGELVKCVPTDESEFTKPDVCINFTIDGRIWFKDGALGAIPSDQKFMEAIQAALKDDDEGGGIPGCTMVRVENLNVKQDAPCYSPLTFRGQEFRVRTR